MIARRTLAGLIFIACLVAPASAQPAESILFDEQDVAEVEYLEASSGVAADGDFLQLAGPAQNRLPLTSSAFSGSVSGLLRWRHVPGGSWSMDIAAPDVSSIDLTGFDSLVVYLNGPDMLSGAELPGIGLKDADGTPALTSLSQVQDVRVNELHSVFTPESATNVYLVAEYSNVLPREQRRPGYPEDLIITFDDVPLDTSLAAIGAPERPAHFRVMSATSGLQHDFRFYDFNQDSTLSEVGEYIEVLMPEAEGSSTLRPTWRIEVLLAPEPVIPPTTGDVFELKILFDEFTLDDDPDTWERRSVPISSLTWETDLDLSQIAAVVFTNGGVTTDERTLRVDRISVIRNDDEAFLDELQRHTFDFFWNEANPANGLVVDRTRPGAASSIASVGFALSAYTVGIDRGWITREQGAERTLTTLRFFWDAPHGPAATNVTGYKGFFYHFLDMQTGYRRGTTELSTVDSSLLLAGVLHAGEYFDGSGTDEVEIRTLAAALYERVDWQWAQARPPAISHGWRPESGFIGNDWIGYNEAMIVYVLALGSPTHPVEPAAWNAWTRNYSSDWGTFHGYTFLSFPPLFGHQYSHVWIDFRGIQDEFMRGKGIDYFENSRRATLAQRAYHAQNPNGWPNYGPDEWGLTASDTPTGYRARGAPPAQNDDGTLVPTAPGGSIAFTPEESIAALRQMRQRYPGLWGPYGFYDAYNVAETWVGPDYIGIDQGPILLMAENYRTERIWDVFMQNESIQLGLEKAGFMPTDTAVDHEQSAPSLELENYPDPFSSRTEIRYRLPQASKVRLVVYDVLGREVDVLVDETQAAGVQSRTFLSRALPSGLYFFRLVTPDGARVGTMMHVR